MPLSSEQEKLFVKFAVEWAMSQLPPIAWHDGGVIKTNPERLADLSPEFIISKEHAERLQKHLRDAELKRER